MNRRMRSDLMKLGQLLSSVSVSADAGGLTVEAGEHAFRLLPIGPDLFRVEGGDGNAYWFTEQDTGTEHLVIRSFLTLDKVSGWRNPRWHAAFGVAALALFAGTLAGWGLGFAARRLLGAGPSPTTLAARSVASLACALLLAGLAITGRQLDSGHIFDVMIELPPLLVAGLVAGHVAVPFVLALPVYARRGFRPEVKAPLARLHYGVLALVGLVLLAQGLYWNLLGPAAWR